MGAILLVKSYAAAQKVMSGSWWSDILFFEGKKKIFTEDLNNAVCLGVHCVLHLPTMQLERDEAYGPG